YTKRPLRPARVDQAEAGSGEGHEQPRMPTDRLRHALAAPQPGGKKVELVGLVGRRAGGAHRGPSVATGLEEGGVWLPVGVIDGADLTRCRVGVVDAAAQAHRVGTVASR